MFTRLPGVLARIADPTVSTPDGFGVGSRLDELVDAGVTLELSGADRWPVTEIVDARYAVVNGLNLVTLESDQGTVTSIMVQNPGSC